MSHKAMLMGYSSLLWVIGAVFFLLTVALWSDKFNQNQKPRLQGSRNRRHNHPPPFERTLTLVPRRPPRKR